MSNLTRENFSRIEKLLFDAEDAASPEKAREALAGFSVNVVVGPEHAHSPQHQIALLTLCILGTRCLPGGVRLQGLDPSAHLLTPMLPFETLGDAVEAALGAQLFESLPQNMPVIHLGATIREAGSGTQLRASFGNWSGCVSSFEEEVRLAEDDVCPLAPVLASALAISEVFQFHRARLGHRFANIEAGYRTQGLSLWDPAVDANWEGVHGPHIRELLLPESFWLLGLGHLGQAYAWGITALPFPERERVRIVLNDYDRATPSNLETSILTTAGDVGKKKARYVASHLERMGFGTDIVERPFDGTLKRMPLDPEILLCGVDNLEVRRHLDEHGFPLVVDAGLGGGHGDYLEMALHRFPGSVAARHAYPDQPEPNVASGLLMQEGYRKLTERIDPCGIERLAGAAIGVPFVGTVASSLVLAWAIRQHGLMDSTDRLSLSLDSVRHRRCGPIRAK